MHPPGRLGHARRLVIGFVAIAGGLTIALGLLSWRSIALEEDLDEQRIQQRLETAADSAVSTLAAGVAETERWLQGVLAADETARDALIAEAPRPLPPDSVVLILGEDEITAHPASGLIYYPFTADEREGAGATTPPVIDALFADVDVLEYQDQDFDAAAARLRQMAATNHQNIRATALIRLGRILKRQGDGEGALSVFEDLEDMEEAWVEDLPAPLWAAVNRCEVLAQLGRPTELRTAADDFIDALRSGRWRLTAGTYHFYADKAAAWGADAESIDREALALAADEIWLMYTRGWRGAAGNVQERSIVWARQRPFVVLTAVNDATRVVLVAGPQFVARHWVGPWQPTGERQEVDLELLDAASGRTMYATRGDDTAPAADEGVDPLRVPRTPDETGLPWSVRVTSTDQAMEIAGMARQRALLLVGLALVTGMLLTSVYFISQAVTREFEVARLQSDFVAAVSHEFRSPLTSMRHLIELLGTDRVPDDATRSKFYGVLEREAGRLQRLVEQVLDFRRLDEGAIDFEMEPIDAASFVAGVVGAFRDDAGVHGVSLEVTTNGSLPSIRGDRDALARALWNLLENAVRYSPDCDTVWLEVATVDDRLAISVRDRGIGIPHEERRLIFRKFVRGSNGQRLETRGTGLGLAMVDEIVRAHGGAVSLESEVGKGSTFTITLPLQEAVS